MTDAPTLTRALDLIRAAETELLALMMAESTPPSPPISGRVLDVPYLSQWDIPDADDRPGDCGPACVAMIIHHLTSQRPTVDEVATACGQPTTGSGRWTTRFDQLVKGARAYGLAMRWTRPLTIDELCARIDMSKPSVALINYGVLGQRVENQDDFTGGHFVVVVGYDDECIIVHDSNWGIGGERRDEGAFRRIPRDVYELAASTPALKYFTYGWQGLVLE